MKKFRKPLKFYLTLFILSSIFIFAYTIYRVVFDQTPISELYTTWFLPIFFIGIYYGSDFILDKIFNRKKKINYEGKFLDAIGERMRKDKAFSIEDFRRLQINPKFQESLKIAYIIYQEGENETFNIEKLKRKFSKDKLEYRAMIYVIDYLEENIDRNGKKDSNKV